jgi:hypothetical protein
LKKSTESADAKPTEATGRSARSAQGQNPEPEFGKHSSGDSSDAKKDDHSSEEKRDDSSSHEKKDDSSRIAK